MTDQHDEQKAAALNLDNALTAAGLTGKARVTRGSVTVEGDGLALALALVVGLGAFAEARAAAED